MLLRLLLLVALGAGLYILLRHGRRPSSMAPWQRTVLLIAGLSLGAGLLARGGAELAAPLLAVLLPLLLRSFGTRHPPVSPSSSAGSAHPGASTDSAMSRDEAFEVLGLSPGASQDDIRAAHRRLIQRMHPDRGGSAYLAARLNQARRVLLDDCS